ncbi:hypothetical protein [Kitasatospora mediocidica]|uniref:hypothetical protein n=1 Tax=Kitasatospora mediocidica TaxID=58352 RepID=UPI000561F25F|nr:hypothetical protein [Kitasatospora mediocidica]
MHFQTCRRHPSAGRFMATCSGCAQELHDLKYGKAPRSTPTPAASTIRLLAETGDNVALGIATNGVVAALTATAWEIHGPANEAMVAADVAAALAALGDLPAVLPQGLLTDRLYIAAGVLT